MRNGEFDAALDALRQLEASPDLSAKARVGSEILLARILSLRGDYSKASTVLERTLSSALELGDTYSELETGLLLAISYHAMDNQTGSRDQLTRVEGILCTAEMLEGSERSLGDLRGEASYVKGILFQSDSIFEPAIACFRESLDIWERSCNLRLVAKALNSLAAVHDDKGELDTAFEFAEKALAISEEVGELPETCKAHVVLGNICRLRGDLHQALAHYETGREIQEQLGSVSERAMILNSIGIVHNSKGDHDLALASYQESLKDAERLGMKGLTGRLHNNIGAVYAQRADADLALKHFNAAMNIREAMGDERKVALLLNNIGVIHQRQGRLDDARACFQRSLKIMEGLGVSLSVAFISNNIGEIFQHQGELLEAEGYYRRSLAIFEETGSIEYAATTLNNIGLLFQSKGEFGEARNCYRQSLKFRQEIGNDIFSSDTLFSLVTLAVDMGDLDFANDCLKMLEEIDVRNDSKQINQRRRVSEAYILKASERHVRKSQAQQMLERVCNEEVLNHELTVFAMLNLFELLLFELRSSGIEDVFTEAKELSGRLMRIASEQGSFSLLAEVYLLQSKLALIELDIKRAEMLLAQSELTAIEKNLTRLSIKISNQQDVFLSQVSSWNELAQRGASYSERMDLVQLEHLISPLVQRRVDDAHVEPEEPVMLLVLNSETGVCLFSHSFVGEQTSHTQLDIGGFLGTIDLFMSDVFDTSGSIQRIKHQEFTLTMRPSGSLRFWYVFRGSSYSAAHKLDDFIDVVGELDSLRDCLTGSSSELTEKQLGEMRLSSDRVFVTQD